MSVPTSPWLTVQEAADRIRRHRNYIYKALWAEQAKAGSGLRGRQLVEPQGSWLIHLDDLDAWVSGDVAPRRLKRSACVRATFGVRSTACVGGCDG